ncbi:hypothetical protein M409DRAFT_28000 [Zasmidium cellare ATCC 36951]|uniref:Uncharacterized protein n=1 Tax=Zasmidium cellare ATCC 36951 TaxID=1080233 RepID=A0A6A6C863_ZASCE|nr:uncharacterized protein M409DRAFT_28000 [Zasmidium cellare ATCC 36951]KAF2161606.1 hypothetical protein M409DRAFT_28000 [Zasmidium cellare ATCC 36951]
MPSNDSNNQTNRQTTSRQRRRQQARVQTQWADRQPFPYGTNNYRDNVRRLKELEEHLKRDVDEKMP